MDFGAVRAEHVHALAKDTGAIPQSTLRCKLSRCLKGQAFRACVQVSCWLIPSACLTDAFRLELSGLIESPGSFEACYLSLTISFIICKLVVLCVSFFLLSSANIKQRVMPQTLSPSYHPYYHRCSLKITSTNNKIRLDAPHNYGVNPSNLHLGIASYRWVPHQACTLADSHLKPQQASTLASKQVLLLKLQTSVLFAIQKSSCQQSFGNPSQHASPHTHKRSSDLQAPS
jgi:hypothetical protein